MKILVTSLPDIRRIPVQRPHHLLLHLTETHDVSVRCVQSNRDLPRQDPFIEDLVQRLDFRYLTGKQKNPAIQELAWAFRKSLSRELHEGAYDVHLNLNSLLAGSRVASLLSAEGIPTILDIGDDLPATFAENAPVPSWISGLITPVSTRMLQRSIRSVAALTYITEVLAEKYHFPARISTRIPNGVDCTLFCPSAATRFRENRGMDPEEYVFGTMGHLNRWVDLETPLLALRSLVREGRIVRMLVVGGGEYLPWYRKMAGDLGIADRVTFTGPVSYAKGPALIQAMDLCLLCRKPTPASQASLPMKVFEFMACGKPVLATPLAGVRETFGDHVAYAGTPGEVASSLSHFMDHRDAAMTAGAANRAFVEKDYTWEKICTRFDRVLEGVASHATAR
jgi:glycosyltransferase involved in cell wall biosynthesis